MIKYALFITSHKNPSVCRTLDTLKGLNYNGEYYIVIDDEDPLIEQYQEIYKDKLLVFNKRFYMITTDSGHDSEHTPSACVLYARNFIEDVSKKLGLDAFIMCDDDILNFVFRPVDEDNKKILRTQIKDINEVINAYFEFLLENDLCCIGFGTPNFYFSGYEGFISGGYLTRRSVSNFFFRNVKRDIKWNMPMEDFNTAIKYGVIGHLFLSPAFVEVEVAPQHTQKGGESREGGMALYYANSSSFTRAFYSTMIGPSYCLPKLWKGKYIPQMSKDNAYPKIISSKYNR